MQDRRLFSEAAARNRDPILHVLKSILPSKGRVLEIASGSGEHIVHLASALPALTFQPTDPSAQARDSIAAWAETAGLANVLPPLRLDATESPWPVEQAGAVICINMIHISPWRATECVFSWNRNPATGLICIQSGPRSDGSTLASGVLGGSDWNAYCGDDRQDTPGVFIPRQVDQGDLP